MISSAFAQSAAGGAGGFSLQGLLPFVLIFIIFYFLLIRPQQKRIKEHKAMVNALNRGDQVITAGGLVGKIERLLDDEKVEVQIAENVNVKIVKSTISQVLSKTDTKK